MAVGEGEAAIDLLNARLEGVDGVRQTEVRVHVVVRRHEQRGLVAHHRARRAAAVVHREELQTGHRGGVHRPGDQAVVALADGDGHGHHRRLRLAGDLLGGDGVLSRLGQRRGRAHDGAGALVQREALGERGLHLELRVVGRVGEDLGELHVEVAVERVVGEVGDVGAHAVHVQVQAVHSPRAVRAGAAVPVLEAVDLVRLAVRQVDLLLLRRVPPSPALEGAQRRPVVLALVLRLHHHAVRQRGHAVVVVGHAEGCERLSAVAVEGDLQTVRAAAVHVHAAALGVAEGLRAGRHALHRDLVVVHTAVRLVAEELHRGVEGGRLVLVADGEQTDGDGVRARVDEAHRLLRVRGHRAQRQRHHVVLELRVHLLRELGGRERARETDAVRLDAVQVHDERVARADGHHDAADGVERSHVEGLLVQLDAVGGLGEAAHRALLPASGVAVVPVVGHAAHLVVPRALRGHRVVDAHQVLVAQLQHAVAVDTQQDVLVALADAADVQEAVDGPRRRLRGHQHAQTRRLDAHLRHARLGAALRGVEGLGEDHVARVGVQNAEGLIAGVLVGVLTLDHEDGVRAGRGGQREGGGVVSGTGDHGGHGEGSGGELAGNDAGDLAARRVQRQTLGEGGRDGAAHEALLRRLDHEAGDADDGLVGGLLVGHGIGRGQVADVEAQLGHLHAVHQRLRHDDARGAEVLRVEQRVAEGARVNLVLDVVAPDEGRVLAAGGREARHRVLGGDGGDDAVGVNGNTVDHGTHVRVVVLDVGVGHQQHGVDRRQVAVERVLLVVVAGNLGGHRLEALGRGGVGVGARVLHHPAVEAHGGGGRRLRVVKLHGENARTVHFRTVADHAIIVRSGVATVRGSGGCDGASGHVVAEDFVAVQVRNDTVLELETHFVRGEIRQAGEGLAEVLGARRFDGGVRKIHRGPLGVVKRQRSPTISYSARGNLPAGVLFDRFIHYA